MEPMDGVSQDSANEPEEGQNDGGMFMWTPVEFDAALQAEGLFGLEVLQDECIPPAPKKAKKSKKTNTTEALKKLEHQVESETPQLSNQEIEEATKGWNKLLFDEWTFPMGIRRNLHSAGMVAPTVIQNLVFKSSLTAGTDIVACAETGSGKTLAYSLPIVLSLLKRQRSEEDQRPVLCLAILPTRELALQVKDSMTKLVKDTALSAFALIGGISIQKQERVLKHKPEIVVATPGRLWDIMKDVEIKFDLMYLVLDEADRLVTEQSFKELGDIISKVKGKQTRSFIYSATILNRDKDLQALFKLLKVKNPTVCLASHKGDLVLPYDQFLQTKPFKKKQEEEASNTTLPKNLAFKVIKCFDDERELKLVAYLMEKYSSIDMGHIIIFVNSISYAYRLEPLLSIILWRDKHELRIAKKHCMTLDREPKFNYITSLHSKLKQKQRLKRLEQFIKSDKAIMICTDVAARGVDLPNITEVIHFQAPRTASIFIHRSGRTARFSAEGSAICMCESSEVDTWDKLFKAINKNMAQEEELLSFIPQKQYQRYKRLLTLASAIESREHQLSKNAKTESWLHTAAKQADILLSDDESDEDTRAQRSKTYKSLKMGKRALLDITHGVMQLYACRLSYSLLQKSVKLTSGCAAYHTSNIRFHISEMKGGAEQTKKRLKVVFLHGFTQTDESFRMRTLAFKTTCSKYLDIKYVCSPHVLTQAPAFHDESRNGKEDEEIRAMEDAAREAYIKEYGAKETYGNTWFYLGKHGEYSSQMKYGEVKGLEESLKVVFDACKEHQADGIMGFSLGGLMTAIAAQKALEDDSIGWKPKFVVMFSPPMIGNQNIFNLLEKAAKVEVPSLFLISENDTIVRPERSYRLLKYFKEPEVKFHSSAHTVPHTECKEVFRNFFTRFL
ncbi:ATP-dependent RNA helicase [Babesia ovis]|uniref:ATP-dependent RNA helicase n=1 Tax=Babesia ovis TaxID=5869 RepID=A0A9W5TCV8_BABOV|nr:ATP-dependent RNA helicase [Babesia ovis]